MKKNKATFSMLSLFILFFLITLNNYAEQRNSISQYGITWTFSQTHECGQFANGDWWVVGPINITSISPAPSGGRHGSMVNPLPMTSQSYDNRIGSYSSTTLFTSGTVGVNSSVVSTISKDVGGNNRDILKTAAVLTVLGIVPPNNGATVFRPPYLGSNKPLYSTNDLDPNKLQNLPMVSSAPAASSLAEKNKRVQLTHLAGTQTRGMMPADNMETYGAGNCRNYGVNYLCLSLDYSLQDKMPLLINMVQIGIDFYGATLLGMEWLAHGGYSSGKKMAILFAGHMLNNSDMLNIMQTYPHNFAEDCQTFYTTENPPTQWGTGIYETLDPKYGPNFARYAQRHCTNPTTDQYHGEIARGGGSTYSTYWTVNSYSWIGQSLAALFYDLKDEWAHDAYFDHQERYIETKGFTGTWGSTFADEMWATYRHNFTPVNPTIVANPSISPNGGTHTGSVTVSITTSTAGATIYYTDDNSTPTEASTVYTQPFTLVNSKTIKAKAFRSDLDPSSVITANYVVNIDNQAPVISSVPNTPNPNEVTVIFSESVTTTSAETVSNYNINNGISISSASLGADQKTVTLTTSTLSPISYTLTVNNIEDFWNNVITANSTASFTYVNGQTSTSSWQTFSATNQTGVFTAEFDAIPNNDNMDGVIGILSGTASVYGDLACIVRFTNGGTLDARDGGAYTSDNTIAYSAGTSYHFRLEIDIPNHTYDIYVTQSGGSEQILGANYAFRTDQASVSSLDGWAITAVSGSHLAGNMIFSTGGSSDTEPVLATIGNQTVTEGQTLIVPVSASDADGDSITLSDTNLPAFCTFVDNGNGTGILTISPATSDAGSYSMTITANANGKSDNETIAITVISGEGTTLVTSVTQYGITWYFDHAVEAGQFVNGDWWVVGPVTVTSVSPGPRAAIPEEVNDLGNNAWGDIGLQDNTTRRNGSMVVMSPSSSQGYDSRGTTYNAGVSLSFPYSLDTNRSLISSISNDTIPQQVIYHEMMWASEKIRERAMKTAAVLTCLASAPPTDAFRPTYIGGTKTIYRLSDVQWDKLLNLPATASMPEWERFERYLERPWLDHFNATWQAQWLLPNLNQPSYGRENARIMSMASLMLHTDAPLAQKEKLAIRLIQIGIDLHGIAEAGGVWNSGGGHTSGRKFPILFASEMLGQPDLMNMPSTALFHEDVQTYYGTGWAGQTALWQMIAHHGTRLPYMHIHPSQWSTYDDGWAENSESYRTCCNIQAWVGQALSTLLMGAKGTWDHNAFFDNVEDWMRQEDIYTANRDGYARPLEETTTYPPYDNFVSEIWQQYRSQVPAQPDGTTNLMWDVLNNQWVSNPPPGVVATPVISPNGGTYSGAVIVKISCGTASASIYYSDDGSDPDQTSMVYTGPITLTNSGTIKAKAYSSIMDPSAINSATFTIVPDSDPPLIESIPITLNANQVVIKFNEPVEATSAETISNYSIGAITISNVSLSSDLRTATLVTSTMAPGFYTLTINNVKDLSDNVIATNSSGQYKYFDGHTSSGSFQTYTESTQNGVFRAEFDAIPNNNNMDGATGICLGSASAYGDLACIIRFNSSGNIDARDGGAYTSSNTIIYSAGTLYHFRLEIDVPNHVYDIYVTPEGDTEQAVGTGYTFRTEQASVTSLDSWAITAFSGSHTVGNMQFFIPGSDSAPILASIGDQTVTESEILVVPLSASDADGDAITLSDTDLPSFCTFIDNGNGTGTLTISPAIGDEGSYSIKITASANSLSDSETFSILVNAASIPVTQVIEAEDYSANSGCSVSTQHAGYTGTGFVDYGGNGTYAEWDNIEGGSGGTATLTVRYANGSSENRSCNVEVNGQVVNTISFSPTGDWTSWATTTIDVDLSAGSVNTIRIVANSSDGGPNADNLEIVTSDAPVVEVTGIEISSSSLNMDEGDTANLTATVTPANATYPDVTWSTSNDLVATVSDGLVSAISAGNTIITATTVNGLTATCDVIVIPIQTGYIIDEDFSTGASNFTEIAGGTWSVSGGRYELTNPGTDGLGLLGNISVHNTIVNGDFELSTIINVTGTTSGWNDIAVLFNYQDVNNYAYVSLNESNDGYTDGVFKIVNGTATELYDINFNLIASTDYLVEIIKTGQNVVFKLDGNQIATVSDASFNGGKVGYGTKNDGATFDNLLVSNGEAPVIDPASITLDQTSIILDEGQSSQLTETVLPIDADDKFVTWSSSNTSVASVSGGLVSAINAGSAIITATTVNGLTATCNVTVNIPIINPSSISLDQTSLTLDEGQSEQLTETVLPVNADDNSVTWTSSNTSVATVSNGLVSAVSAGSATIIATTVNGLTASCNVTVLAPVLQIFDILGNSSDRVVYNTGTLWNAAKTQHRVGRGDAGYNYSAAVIPFALPDLAGATITGASFKAYLQGRSSGISGNVDVYALPYRSGSSVLSTDYYAGSYDGDPHATAIEDNLATPSTPLNQWTEINSGAAQNNLVAFLNTQLINGALAGDFIFIRLSPDAMETSTKYYDFRSANYSDANFYPVLTIEAAGGGTGKQLSKDKTDIKASNGKMLIFPNPNQGDILNIFIKGFGSETVLQIHDITGKLISKKVITTEFISEDISFLNKGIYIINVSNKKYLINKKLVIR